MTRPGRSIGEVLEELKEDFPDITLSKIRFLETQGLIDPKRSESGIREFTDSDVQLLRWVLQQQRDHFLPLKVIKERIQQGAVAEAEPTPNGTTDPVQNLFNAGPSSVSFTLEELSTVSGLSVPDLQELKKFGLIEPLQDGAMAHYGDEAVIVAKVAAGFKAHGIDPRHLRAYKSAAEREVGLLEQRIMPLVMQRTPQARQQLQQVLAELVRLGGELRLSVLRKALAHHRRR